MIVPDRSDYGRTVNAIHVEVLKDSGSRSEKHLRLALSSAMNVGAPSVAAQGSARRPRLVNREAPSVATT